MKNCKNNLSGTLDIFSGMNSACPRPNGCSSGRANCKGRRAVKNYMEKPYRILNNQRHPRPTFGGSVPLPINMKNIQTPENQYKTAK